MATSRVCSIPDCGKPAKARGWCDAHYSWMRKHGAPKITRSNCSVGGCDRKHYGRGYCSVHIRRLDRNGHPERTRVSTSERIRVAKDAIASETEDCILWPFGKPGNHYNQLTINGETILVHRYVCMQVRGLPAPHQTDCAHSCGHKRCINPRHLRWATRRENSADMIAHGTRIRGEQHWTAKLTDELARQIKFAEGNNTQVAKRFGVDRQTARDIRKGKRWRHV